MRDLLVSATSPSRAFGIGQRSVVNSLAFFPTLTLDRVERGAAAAKAQPFAAEAIAMVKLSAVLALGVSCWLGVGLPVDLAVANTCANCGRQPIRFKTGKPVRVEVVNFTAGLVLLEDVQASDPIPVSPGRTFRLTRRTSTEGPNGSVVFWDAQGLPLRATVRQPVIDLMRIELRPWGQQPGDRSVYLEDDGRVSVL